MKTAPPGCPTCESRRHGDIAPPRFSRRHLAAVAALIVAGALVAWPVFLTGFLAWVSLGDCFLDDCTGPDPGMAAFFGAVCLALLLTPLAFAGAVLRRRWRWAVPLLVVAVPVTLWTGGFAGVWSVWT